LASFQQATQVLKFLGTHSLSMRKWPASNRQLSYCYSYILPSLSLRMRPAFTGKLRYSNSFKKLPVKFFVNKKAASIRQETQVLQFLDTYLTHSLSMIPDTIFVNKKVKSFEQTTPVLQSLGTFLITSEKVASFNQATQSLQLQYLVNFGKLRTFVDI
jgi:hypothetical protein